MLAFNPPVRAWLKPLADPCPVLTPQGASLEFAAGDPAAAIAALRRVSPAGPVTQLVLRADDIAWPALEGIRRLGLTAGASAPETLVEEIIDAFAARYAVKVETVSAAEEGVFFPLPRPLRQNEAAE